MRCSALLLHLYGWYVRAHFFSFSFFPLLFPPYFPFNLLKLSYSSQQSSCMGSSYCKSVLFSSFFISTVAVIFLWNICKKFSFLLRTFIYFYVMRCLHLHLFVSLSHCFYSGESFQLFFFSRSTVLYCTVLHCTVLYCTALYRTVPYYTVLYCTAVQCTVLYCTEPYCSALYCTVLYCTVLNCTALYRTILYCTVPYYTALY